MFKEYRMERGAFRKSIFYLTVLLFILLPLLSTTPVTAAEPDIFPQSFGFHIEGSGGTIQTYIDQLSKQLTAEPYRAELYYHLARAYDKQGWHDKATQYMNQWIKSSNSDMVVNDSHAFMVDEKNDKVLVIDKNTKKVVREINVGWFPKKVIPTPDGTKLYVTNALANSVSSINAEKMAVTSTIKAGKMPWNGKCSPQGDRAYIANLKSNDVSVFDTNTDTLLETVGVGQGPWGIAISPDGHRMYVSNQDSRDIQIIDTGSYSIVDVITIGTHPRDIALAPDDENKLYAIDGDIVGDEVEIYVVDLADARIVKALNASSTNDPLLARFEKMSFEDKLKLIGTLAQPGEMAKNQIQKPGIVSPRFSNVSEPSSAPLRAVITRDAEPKQVELPMGGPVPLMEPLMEAYVKVPAASTTARPMPLPEPVETSAEEAPEQQPKQVLRIIVVVKYDTLWKIALDNYGIVNNSVYKKIQVENPTIKDVNKIYVGQAIKLPVIYTGSEETYAGKTVVVGRDDNLFRLALHNYGMVNKQIYAAILKANPQIRDISRIVVGQRILMPTL